MKRFAAWLGVFTAVLVLVAGCKNGGRAQNSTDMRALNAVPDSEALDVLVDDDVKAAALALGATSGYAEFPSGTRDVKVRSSTTQAVLVDKSLAFPSGTQETLLVYGKRAAIATQVLAEDTIAPPSGDFRFRAVNLAPDSGAVDVYVTAIDLASSTPTLSSTAYGAATDFAQGVAATFTVYVTTAGTKDILFQAGQVTLSASTSYTLAIVPAPGGKLVNAVLLTASGATTLSNPNGRIKAVNAIAGSATINFKVDDAAFLTSVPFTGASSYVGVAAGPHALQLEASNAPGTNLAAASQTVVAGKDYTVLALGSIASPQVAALGDDNTLPAAGFSKVRFVNTTAAPVDALINFASQASAIAPASASSYYTVATATDYTITFTTPGGVSVLATLAPVELDSLGVYSVYLFPGPTGKVARDR